MIVAGGASIGRPGTRFAGHNHMSPGGHLVTTAAACAVTALTSGSLSLTAAVAAGGFFIDLDHAVDYVVFDGQRDLRPTAFLRHFLEGRVRFTVLVLHSYELFAVLAAIAWWTHTPLLSAYLLGALMHLALDIIFNGRITPYSIAAFYSFGYRLAHRFEAVALLGIAGPRQASGGFWRSFFESTPPLSRLAPPTQAIGARAPDVFV